MRFSPWFLAATILAVPSTRSLAAQAQSVTTFIIVEGKDTVSLEQYSRAGNTVTGVWISNQNGQIQVHDYVLTLGADGLPVHYDMAVRFPDGAGNLPPSEAKYAMDFGPDSLTLVTGRSRPVTQHIAMKGGAYPTFGASRVGQDLGLVRLRGAHADSGSIPLTTLGAGRATPLQPLSVTFVGPDSAILGTEHAKIDSEGHLLGWRMAEGVEARRVAPIDMKKFVADLLTADAAAESAARAAHVITLQAAALDRLAGAYAFNATTNVSIARGNDKLTMRFGTGLPIDLLPASATTFFQGRATSGQIIEFETDPAGNATALLVPQHGGTKLRLPKVVK
jgi:uncharacterized protein DUF3471